MWDNTVYEELGVINQINRKRKSIRIVLCYSAG